MRPSEILSLLQTTGAIQDGHFQLSSGLHSRQYIQCAAVMEHPTLSARLCGALARGFMMDNASVVASPAVGGVIVGYELARALGSRSIFGERVEGKFQFRRSFTITPQDRVVIAEDVVTTGGSSMELLELVRAKGATVVGVGALIDRSGGLTDFPVKFHALTSLPIKAFTEKSCPMCKEQIPINKPGSRPGPLL